MTKKLKNYLKTGTLLFGITLLLWNCESENDLDIELQNSTYKVVHTNFDFIAQNKSLLNKVNSLSKKKNNSASKGNTINADDFTIFTNRVTYISPTDGSKESYSFYIERNSGTQTNKIENLILSKKPGESQYNAHIITYFFPDGLHSEHDNFEIINFEEIDAESVSGLYTKSIGCENTYEYNVVETEHECYSGEHSGASETGNCNYENNGGTPPYSTWTIHVTVNYVCDDGSGGGGATDGGPTSDPGTPPNPNPPANPNDVDTGITLPPNCQGNDCDGELVANQINDLLDSTLSYNELLWLNDNAIVAGEVLNFLNQNLNSSQTINVAKKAIEDLISYDETNYPGMEDGFPSEWWVDENFVAENISFNLDDEGFGNLTEAEKKLVGLFPLLALIIRANKQPAESETITRFGMNGRNDKSDAFRHAFFNAMNANDAGKFVAKLFSTAHESEVPPNLIMEKTMDLFNNDVGLLIGDNASIFVSDQELLDSAFQALLDGELRYLSLLGPIVPPNFGINNSTQLIPTNQ